MSTACRSGSNVHSGRLRCREGRQQRALVRQAGRRQAIKAMLEPLALGLRGISLTTCGQCNSRWLVAIRSANLIKPLIRQVRPSNQAPTIINREHIWTSSVKLNHVQNSSEQLKDAWCTPSLCFSLCVSLSASVSLPLSLCLCLSSSVCLCHIVISYRYTYIQAVDTKQRSNYIVHVALIISLCLLLTASP